MKILLVILHADSARGGAEAYTVGLLRALRERDIDASIAASSFEQSINPGWRVTLRYEGLTRTGRYHAFLNSLDAHLADSRYDIVHAMLPVRRCDVYQTHAGVESITFAKANAAQRWTNRRRRSFARVERDLIQGNRPPVVICLSNRSRAEVEATLKIAPERLETLYSGVDDARFDSSRFPAPADPARLVIVGQDFHRKGVDIAIEAAARAGVWLDVVGKDDPTPFLRLATELGAQDRIRFVGPTQDVPAALAGAGVLLLPARFEPFGMVVPEAMLMGVPPIVSKIAGASEIVRDGIDGRVVDGLNVDHWFSAIHDVIAHRESMSRACLARRGELSYSSHLAKLTAIYDRILAAR